MSHCFQLDFHQSFKKVVYNIDTVSINQTTHFLIEIDTKTQPFHTNENFDIVLGYFDILEVKCTKVTVLVMLAKLFLYFKPSS